MRCFSFLIPVFVLISVSLFHDLAFSLRVNRGQNSASFRRFFMKNQPEEYYSGYIRIEPFIHNSDRIVLNYEVLENFSQPNSWGIISPSEQIKDPKSNTIPPHDEELLKWKTLDIKNLLLLPPIDATKSVRHPLPEIMGVRSLFLYNGYRKIQVYPKEPLLLPLYDNRYLEVWIFGIKIHYNVFIILEDKKGILHRTYMGTLEHDGWKRLRGKITFPTLERVIDPTASRTKIHSISFESMNTQTEGFFGTWISDLGVLYIPKLNTLSPNELSVDLANDLIRW